MGAPPVPLTATYKAKLKTAILATRREGVQIFNTAVLALASKSILQLDQLRARQRVDTLVAEMDTVVHNIRRWFRDGQTSRSSSAHGPCHCQPQLEMLQALACKGMPRLGYLQNLMCCLYKYGNFPGVDRLEWPCFYEFPNIGTGCAASITHLTGSHEVCVSNGSLIALRLYLVSEVLKEDWKNHGPQVKFPHRQSETHTLAEAVGHQFDEWNKVSHGELVQEPASMTQAFIKRDYSLFGWPDPLMSGG